jgi:phospholipid transport system transporter-binding protein
MIVDKGDRIEVTGAMTLSSATALLNEGLAFAARGDAVFDMGGVTDIDSSGLAVIFGWQREAQKSGKSIRIVNFPENLKSLSDVYGVGDLLPA